MDFEGHWKLISDVPSYYDFDFKSKEKNFFNNNAFYINQKIELFHKITYDLTYIVNNNNFQNIILGLDINSLSTQIIYGSCMTMQAYFNYSLPSQDENIVVLLKL